MSQWMQCNFIQTVPQWADSSCNLPAPGGHFQPPDDTKRRKEERKREESRRETIALLFQHADDLPAAERLEVEAIAERFSSAEIIGRIDYPALLAQAELVSRLVALEQAREAAVMKRRADDDDDEEVLTMGANLL